MKGDIESETVGRGAPDLLLDEQAIRDILDEAIKRWRVGGKRVLVLLPDRTRTAPIALLYRLMSEFLHNGGASGVTFLIAQGTHRRLERRELEEFLGVELDVNGADANGYMVRNHAWRSEEDLMSCGEIERSVVEHLSEGRMHRSIPVKCNSQVAEHDLAIVVGPVFPHEVVGFSGGNKYFFPGISSPEMIDASHWLGALITSRSIIGTLGTTPVRALIDLAASKLPIERKCLALVVSPARELQSAETQDAHLLKDVERGASARREDHHDDAQLCGLYAGSCEAAWQRAAALSAQVHILRITRPYRRVVSLIPSMYEDIWTAAKGMYKLEPVVADGGEVILYAPHISEFSTVHGALIEKIGYHCRDYFLGQWDRFANLPAGVLAHSTHLRGEGTFDAASGIEHLRIAVTLATGISAKRCKAVGLGYLDTDAIDLSKFRDEETLIVPRAGEMLYRLTSDAAVSHN